jgi:ABC-type uncharacterized transport system involved in gliding motility auxiliary subunit
MTRSTISNLIHSKHLKLLFWLAPLLITAGLTVGVLSVWGTVAFVLLALGLGLAIAWLVVETRGGFWARRSTQVGTNALLATVAMIAILGLINFMGVRYSRQLDLTENQVYTLAPQTQEVLQNLEEPTKVWVFAVSPNPSDQRLLETYARTSDQFSFEYVDPQADPVLARQFGLSTPGEVFVERGGERRPVQTVNPGQPLSERSLTSAIAAINADPAGRSRVYFVQGHGERPLEPGQGGYSEVVRALEQENYQVEPLEIIAEATVPEDAGVVIIAGPQRELLEPEVEAIANYLQGPGGVMLLIDPTFSSGLDEVLAEWGISLGEDTLIVDRSGQALGLGPGVPLITEYGNHPITQELNGFSFYPIAQPIALEEVPGVTSTPLLITSPDAEVQRIDESGEVQTDEGAIQQGVPLAVGVAAEREVTATPAPAAASEEDQETSEEPEDLEAADPEIETEETETDSDVESLPPVPETPAPEAADATDPATSRLVVIGNSSFASDGLFGQQLNGDVFLNAVNWLSQDETAIAIRPREVTNRRILLTTGQQVRLGVLSLVVVPLAGLGVAIALWWRRR